MNESKYNIHITKSDGKMLCYNAISGGFAEIDWKAKALIEKTKLQEFSYDQLDECEKATIDELVKGNIIVKQNEDEPSKLILRNRLTSYGSNRTFALTILPTLRCNLNCKYCFEGEKTVAMDRNTIDKIKELFDKRLKEDDLRLFAVNWFGGEPLLEFGIITELSEYFIENCSKSNVRYYADIVSNCTLLDEEKAKKMKDLNITSMQVTLDGPRRIHDSQRTNINKNPTFDLILNNIEKCSKYLPFAVRVNLSAGSDSWFDEFFSEIKHLAGNNNISLYPGKLLSHATSACSSIESSCYNTLEFSQVSVEFYKKSVEYGFGLHWYPRLKTSGCCATSPFAMTIQPDGSLCRCWSQVGSQQESYGNINDFDSSFNPENYYKWILFDIEKYSNTCHECIYFPICAGSCPANWIPQTSEYMKGNNRLPAEDKCCSIRYNLTDMLSLLYETSNKVGG